MDQHSGTDWLDYIWEAAKVVLAALGTVGSSIVIWAARNHNTYVAMLKRHEELHRQNDRHFGEQRQFREEARKGPIGMALVEEIEGLKKRDRRLHRRLDEQQTTTTELSKLMVELRTDIKWMRREMEMNGNGDNEQ